MKKILILTNSLDGLYRFRNELVVKLLNKDYKVILSAPSDSKEDYYRSLDVEIIKTKISRRSINPFKDLILFFHYLSIIKKFRPDLILTYTIKSNINGGLAAKLTRIPYMANITGLGTAVENKGILQFITTKLYKISLNKCNVIFFQNKENMDFMLKRKISGKNNILLPGSGVNIEKYDYLDYPEDSTLHFLFIGRIMKEKGIDYYLDTAKILKGKYPNLMFHVLGEYEDNYKSILADYEDNGIIIYHGKVEDIKWFLKTSHCTIHPTYYPEGMSNVLLESASSGRPIISTDRSGCKEIIEDGENGYLVKPKNLGSLVEKVEQFVNLSYEEKKEMGIKSRAKIIEEFDRKKVVDVYVNEIEKLGNM